MPYAYSSRYQSRLFNFVNQQSRRLGDRLQSSFRHLQVAASWSLEALLHPVHLLLQRTIDSPARQLNRKEQTTKQYLQESSSNFGTQTIPSGDAPIQQVLHAVEDLQRKVVVQGIASELVSRNLVLVSTDNQILNILTQEQQTKLQDRILTEIAKYWRESRLTAEKNETKLLTEIDRLLTKLSSPKPKNTPALVSQTTGYEISAPNAYPIVALLDTAVAKLESNALVPVQQQISSLYQTVQTQLNIFVERQEQLSTVERTRENQGLNIQLLIWQAINFFFGKSSQGHVEGNKINSYPNLVSAATHGNDSTSQEGLTLRHSADLTELGLGSFMKRLLESPQMRSLALVESPWLSQKDFFGESKPTSERGNNEELLLPSPQTNPQFPSSPRNLIKTYQKFFQKSKSSFGLSQVTTKVNELAPLTDVNKQGRLKKLGSRFSIAASLINQSRTDSNKGELFQQGFHTTEREAKPDWIETQAEIIGYEKHPLELILEWLDRMMLFLEEILLKIFQRLQKLWQKR
ncbi:hypothetical protein G7B40_010495 [Aetokthonos hydrillicola Thurmond2011]|jgi:hypothetical protein|uniref:Uncharacterized protein n=1 Tax=Aetokthonos hydrillicola Thurmond2011 TaxID=2712845 RepID=A0AAP5M9S2_9CYAN|nr:hypothetical protein [Aetokthonos hydrillicola]MBO3458944.1 hypothetical protein [Aetokthonos hydrillicola CCALA 1050]MBW4589051.1 hypothetical protein [Aetokthonos hydrillicola CCALA 1050]MDR9894993.1 hypothetical protein [Aetokthonos hydrillicola Thurmond2011]